MEDDAAQAPRTLRGWAVSAVIDLVGYVVITLLLRIWLSWPDALLWALVAIVAWIGADLISDARRRHSRRVP